MGVSKYLHKDKLKDWLKDLSREYQVYAPVKNKGIIEFKPYIEDVEIFLDSQPTAPPKEILFPQTETLLKYRYKKAEQNSDRDVLLVNEVFPDEHPLIFGCRPCGARGFEIFDPVFEQKGLTDPYYKNRRENTCIVSLACKEPENTCFCNWFGSGPADPKGSDLLLIPLEDGYLAEAATEKGEGLLQSALFEEAKGKDKQGDKVKEEALKAMSEPEDLIEVPNKIMQLFDNLNFWEQVSAKCISCGTCTYLCPTCYCFNITDESSGNSGKRIRTWDNCMSFLFTLEGSGHNPRGTKAQRLRNRVGHKFCYYPKNHEGVFACCGCGRCIKSCPTSVDIREIIKLAKEYKDDEGK